VTGLLSYQTNSLRLDPSELPISAEIDSIEQVVVPPARTGLIVRFPVRSGRGALIRIVLDDGGPAPPGAELELLADRKEFFVARRGEAFVTGLQAKNELRLKWNGQSCVLAVELPPGNLDEIARVGPLTCSGIRR
jgi:outer membrane usher protein